MDNYLIIFFMKTSNNFLSVHIALWAQNCSVALDFKSVTKAKCFVKNGK